MAGNKSLIGLGLAGSIGATMLLLACTIHGVIWQPTIVIIFYLIVPFPILISRRINRDKDDFRGQSNPPKEWAYFLTTGIVFSALVLPIIMAHKRTIAYSAALFSIASSSFFFSTILAFFVLCQTYGYHISYPMISKYI